MTSIHDLWVTQQTIVRGGEQMSGMLDFAHGGHLWTRDAIHAHAAANNRHAAPIYITRFPDGRKMIHDGHKRVVATLLGGRDYLLDVEHIVKDWTYESYLEVAPERGFVTPFDPRTECRKDDFLAYKLHVLEMARHDLGAAQRYVADHHHDYAEPRRIHTVGELVSECGYKLAA